MGRAFQAKRSQSTGPETDKGTEDVHVIRAGQAEEGGHLDEEIVCTLLIILLMCMFICSLSASFFRVSASENSDFANCVIMEFPLLRTESGTY